MRRIAIGIALASALGLAGGPVYAQSWRPPADNQRCPSKWGVYEFAFMMQPLKLKGATGSTVAPIAVR